MRSYADEGSHMNPRTREYRNGPVLKHLFDQAGTKWKTTVDTHLVHVWEAVKQAVNNLAAKRKGTSAIIKCDFRFCLLCM